MEEAAISPHVVMHYSGREYLENRRSSVVSACPSCGGGKDNSDSCFIFIRTSFHSRLSLPSVSPLPAFFFTPSCMPLVLGQLDIFLFKRFYEDVRCKLNDLVKRDYSLALLESGTCTHRLRRFSNLA